MDVRKAHVVNPQLKMFPMLRDRQLVLQVGEVEREIALELLLVCDEHAISKHSPSAGQLGGVDFDCARGALQLKPPNKLLL